MPEERCEPVGLAPYSAPEFGYAVPWFANRRPYCGAGSNVAQPGGARPTGAAKTYRSALRTFNVVEPPPPPNGGAAYACCEYRGDGWPASRWRRAYTPAYGAGTRDAQPQWRAAKCEDGRRDGKSGADADPGAATAADHARTNTENFLPRIIKPRKRKKKERKPSAAEATSASGGSSASPQLPKKADDGGLAQSNDGRLYVSRSLLEGLRSAAAVAAATAQRGLDGRLAALKSLRGDADVEPAPWPDDEAVAMLAAMVDAVADEEASEADSAVFCNCRYCDPQGVVWDVKEKRYSANLMRPGALSAGYYTAPPSADAGQQPRPAGADTRQPKKLQVSSQIVTSLNGHRDIEIKFYSSSSEKS